MRHLLLSTVAFAALAGSAFAADLPSTKAPPVYLAPAPVFTWTGFYIGADVGGSFGQASSTTTAFGKRSLNDDGVLGGGYVGYNYQINQFVLGVEGDFQGSGASGSTYQALTDTTNKVRDNYVGSINGRLGIAYDRALFYAIGGVAFGEAQVSTSAGSTLGPRLIAAGLPTTVGYTKERTGFDIGAGVDYAFTPNWIGRIEYRYYDFGSWNVGANSWVPAHHDTSSTNTIRVGLSYLWGASYAAAAPSLAKY
jgi:outer membrane immunogenic protein